MIVKMICFIVSDLLERLMRDVENHHRVRLTVSSTRLSHEIWLPYMSPEQLTADRVLVEVERVLQSQKDWLLNEPILVNFMHAKLPTGQGRGKFLSNLEDYLKKKKCFIRVPKLDNNCCARAIIVAKTLIDNGSHKKSIINGNPVQGRLARELMRTAGIAEGQSCGENEWKKFQHALQDYDLVIISREHLNSIVFRGNIDSQKQLVLYHAENHFSVITKMTAFLGKNYFCKRCLVGYQNPFSHTCKTQCRYCHSPTTCEPKENLSCPGCNRLFVSEMCMQNHYRNGLCFYLKLCRECGKTYHDYREHKCGYILCKLCQASVPKDHKCYIIPKTEKEEKHSKNLTYIFYDFESMMTDNGKHTANLCVAHKVCSKCIEHSLDHNITCSCQRERQIFSGPNTLNDFGDWLWNGEKKKAICIAHNAQAYDLHLIMEYVHNHGKKPDLIQNGQKILCLESEGIKFIDSLNFLPMALAKLPKAFGLKELKKGFFPHLFNLQHNQHYAGPMPDAKYYDPDSMSCDKKAEFLEWYAEQTEFDFQKDIVDYCISDVDILQRCCSKFRALFMEYAAGIDPFEQTITIASACNRVYRTMFLQENQIAIIPPQGYFPGNQSAIAACWLNYLNKENDLNIKHAFNGGEMRIENRLVDGFDIDSNTVYQFHGCFWHGCPICYKNRSTINPVNEITMEELYQKTQVFSIHLRSKGYNLVEIWECQFRQDMAENVALADMYDKYKPFQPLQPREAFFGGRTNATKLYHECNDDENIRYVDFTSLYPWVCKYAKLPLGHPEVYRDTDIPDRVEGLIKCKVLPPQNLLHPVLPYRTRNKLLFPLCRTCAESNIQDFCLHENPEDRVLIGTWVSVELDKAVELGYQILEKYEAWHFPLTDQYDPDTKTGGLWADYINLWLKQKQQASGWPDWVESESDKQRYLRDYEDNEGVKLDANKIEKNEGLRSLAKLMLNSFWGKFGQNPQKDKMIYLEEPKDYIRMMTDDTIEVCDLHHVNDDMIMLRYREKKDFLPTSPNTNVVLAAFTTAYARLKLYDLLEKLQDRVLYYDTDSVIYIHKPLYWNPPLGDFLGQLKDETNGIPITTFVSGGAKNYAYNLETGLTVCKIRGFTLNCRNSKRLNIEVMKNLIVTNDFQTCILIENPHAIKRKKGELFTKVERKNYKLVYDKRVLNQRTFDTVPFGYKM